MNIEIKKQYNPPKVSVDSLNIGDFFVYTSNEPSNTIYLKIEPDKYIYFSERSGIRTAFPASETLVYKVEVSITLTM